MASRRLRFDRLALFNLRVMVFLLWFGFFLPARSWPAFKGGELAARE